MKKYPRTYHLKYSKGLTSDDRVASDVSNLIGSDIIITEKLDGSNTSITKGGLYGRSHADFSKNPWDKENIILQKNIGRYLSDDVYLFGEGMEGIHSITYSKLESFFYLFGVRDGDIWLDWDLVEEYSYLLDIPIVPVLFKGRVYSELELENIVSELVKNDSKLGGELEGIVVRTFRGFVDSDFNKNVFKWVRQNHVQTDIHWTKNWKKATLYKEN